MSTEERTSSGEFAIRPVGAAPLFDAESGKKAALKRWEELKARNKLLVVKNVAEELGVEPETLTYDQAFDHAMLKPLVKKSLKEHVAAIKLLAQLTGELPDNIDAKVVSDQRQVHVSVYNMDHATAEQFRNDLLAAGEMAVAAIVEQQMVGNSPYRIEVPING